MKDSVSKLSLDQDALLLLLLLTMLVNEVEDNLVKGVATKVPTIETIVEEASPSTFVVDVGNLLAILKERAVEATAIGGVKEFD